MLGEITGPFQRTLKTAIGCRGVGLHSGQRVAMTVPAPPESGIVFRRTDAGAEIRANWENAVEFGTLSRCSRTARASTIGTVEHLMAALAGGAVDNAIVELNGPEVPIMDGSAARSCS